MTDEQWEQIRPYAEAAAKARDAFMSAGLWNTVVGDERQRVEQDIAYEHLKTEWLMTSRELAAAQRRIMAQPAAAVPPVTEGV